MSVHVILELTAASNKVDELKALFKEILPDTRRYKGFISIDLFTNQDNPDEIVAIEVWESREAYQTYFNWRAETGLFDQLGPMVAGEPKVRFLDNTGI